MECIKTENGVKITGVRDLDLAQTLDCGQSFRWVENDGKFSGVAFGKKVNLNLVGEDLYIENSTAEDFNSIWKSYLDLELDYGKIREQISEIHPVLKEACSYAPGIRILRQEPWEALCTFIISQNNNIKRIKGIVERLCESFGEKVDDFYTFPTAEKLASLSPEDLAPIRAGFRNKYIIDGAKKVASGEVDLEKCREIEYEKAREELMKIKGVGVKVADCALLFGLHRIEAFPVDVWMRRAMEKLFPNMTENDFGDYAGIAQQYIFHYSRMHPEIFE
ncbi:MAG: DNA-3-methyladenine glycosylase 2 family protein [Ruminococcus sp.]|nr:DNA-3-methyladenine glycosylase 2 family protein [Ruminococcus sp.]